MSRIDSLDSLYPCLSASPDSHKVDINTCLFELCRRKVLDEKLLIPYKTYELMVPHRYWVNLSYLTQARYRSPSIMNPTIWEILISDYTSTSVQASNTK